ncbi:MAG TPA: hypothetical protein EYP31_07950, partial [Roseibacterium sp.]|nr:hypothetical protein [Roseibacterium sp.]
RHDWFTDPDIMAAFEAEYGYTLGVPVNWSAYEDIAEFFTGREIDGETVYGHMDYGRRDPSLGWRFTDAWMSMAGMGDVGVPNGLPVDEWGIRVNENSQPVGSCMARGGATNSPAAVYAIDRYSHWLNNFAPPEAPGMNFGEAGPVPSQGGIAQQIFWYTAFTASMVGEGAEAVLYDDGSPRWRMAPSPHGSYWREGQKVGYQDAGSWTLLESTPVDRAQAAWLYAQFVTSMTVDRKRAEILGLPPMSINNRARNNTAFTISIEAKEGITTGISAADRAHTIAVAINARTGADDIVSPGHVFPIVARDGGVLVRAGHTEAAVDMARLAGLNPSG